MLVIRRWVPQTPPSSPKPRASVRASRVGVSVSTPSNDHDPRIRKASSSARSSPATALAVSCAPTATTGVASTAGRPQRGAQYAADLAWRDNRPEQSSRQAEFVDEFVVPLATHGIEQAGRGRQRVFVRASAGQMGEQTGPPSTTAGRPRQCAPGGVRGDRRAGRRCSIPVSVRRSGDACRSATTRRARPRGCRAHCDNAAAAPARDPRYRPARNPRPRSRYRWHRSGRAPEPRAAHVPARDKARPDPSRSDRRRSRSRYRTDALPPTPGHDHPAGRAWLDRCQRRNRRPDNARGRAANNRSAA